MQSTFEHHCSAAGRFDAGNPLAEHKTRWAVILTALMMVAEITGGWLFNSMALLADGWHMSSHALALGLSLLAYALARRFAQDARFSFGAWKFEVLGGYTSALCLIGVAGVMAWESVARLLAPQAIHYDEAILVAIIGLLVNLACAWLLRDEHHHHDHGHAHDHDHSHQHHDLNLRAAYLHVLADAATSVAAIVALFGGKLWGAAWLDPVMGIAGSLLVGSWAIGLLRQTGRVLLDAEMDAPVVAEIREVIAASPIPATIRDLHVWRIGKGSYACVLSLVTNEAASPDYFRTQLQIHEELVHITVEVQVS
ncbi:CDF family Co(II)/Ni(II) efflux transporter DmeF [Uliginosibacterium sp. 31-16]|uniref:CDF family Co(II)/Ni(II) efflux transporter DmeF n=1 Tax=Uliginosibacterium sp. 31-16 TaxID=3068315 RepID=UPI00273E7917|nr:CDF family Co(II)/Ni(II) efflux transporter DmeF [Uliginosibacterium sp. 31-16]MDP5238867.1 CDF family Co(II)/Ni(II) efflux transporter DmeF [Uliginosibacterium sp. 31-16]